MTQLVDWKLAFSTGAMLAKNGPRVTPEEAAQVVGELREVATLAGGHVRDFTQLAEPAPAPVRIVDRRGWIEENIAGLAVVTDDVLAGAPKPPGLLRTVAAKSTALQAGAVLGFVSGKILGQFDVFSSAQGQLLLVAPNIVEVERKLRVDSRDFRLWVCLHEVTHRTQFGAVPWLRDHFLDRIRTFSHTPDDEGITSGRVRDMAAAISDAIRNPNSRNSLLDLVQNPAQRVVVEELMAMMTLLEGHADFVMDGVGPRVVGSVEQIRSRFEARRKATNPIHAALRRLLGVELKLRQYAEGRRFVSQVVDAVGMAGFNAIWASPATLPTTAELADPVLWIARVAP